MLLDPTWSLNRVVIAGLPGLDLPETLKGRTAYDFLSAPALAQRIREQAPALRLDPELDDDRLRLALGGCLRSADAAVQRAAHDLATSVGRDLGYVLLVLKRGDAINRAARPEWDVGHWARWGAVRRAWLGGGLLSGGMGRPVVQQARRVLGRGGFPDLYLRVASRPAELPLLGAARHLAQQDGVAAVLDMGGSRVKRARVVLQAGRVTALRRMPDLASPWSDPEREDGDAEQRAIQLVARMAAIIAGTWQKLQRRGDLPAATIPVSVAAYVRDGHPVPAQGGLYIQVLPAVKNLENALSRRVSEALDRPLRVKLLHDGTAAANVYSGQPRAAVIMMGTALGIGFPPAV
jgi:hypothetical protein